MPLDATQYVNQIKKSDLVDLKAVREPRPIVKDIFAAVAILYSLKTDWDSCKKTLLANPA